MNILSSLSHHAVLFVHPERKTFTQEIWKELQNDSIAHILHDHTVLDIETARDLISWAQTPFNDPKTALLSFHTITVPAQNALLKILEEPRQTVRFILVTSNKESLLPTLFSRLQEQSSVTDRNIDTSAAKVFLATPPSERMELPCIENLLAQTDEEKRKDRESLSLFILSLTYVLRSNPKYYNHTLLTLETASYASDASASGKSLLEYLSLVLPQTT